MYAKDSMYNAGLFIVALMIPSLQNLFVIRYYLFVIS